MTGHTPDDETDTGDTAMKRHAFAIALAATLTVTACSGGSESTGEPDGGDTGAGLVLTGDASLNPGESDTPAGSVDAATGDDADASADPSDAAPDAPEIALAIERLSPTRGPVTGGTAIAIDGSGFFRSFASGADNASAQTRLFFGTQEVAGLTLLNDLRIEATLPPALDAQPGEVDVVLQNPSGEARCDKCFTYFVPLSLDSVAPSTGTTAGGQWIELSGSGFDGGLTIFFGEAVSPQVEVIDDARARALTPPVRSPGTVPLRAFNKNGHLLREAGFTFESPLTLDALVPRAVSIAGGVTVTMRGQSIDRAIELLVAGQVVPITSQSADAIAFTAPAQSVAGLVSVSVRDAGGQTTGFDGGLLYVDDTSAPRFALWPAHGPSQGGNAVTIAGSAPSRVTAITLDGATLTSADWRLDDDGQAIALTLPPGEAGHVATIGLTLDDGSAIELAYRYDLSLDSVRPARGQAGDWVEISGAGFDSAARLAIRFGATLVSGEGDIERVSDDKARVLVPNGRGSVDIAILDAADATNADSAAQAFTYDEALAIDAISPSSGALAGGDEVSIHGAGFTPGVVTLFGASTLRDVSVESPFRLTGRVPPGSPGAVDVTVQMGSARDTLSAGYTYLDTAQSLGGSTGATIAGTLNVTTFLSSSERIADVRVSVSTDGGATTLASGKTNADGQLSLHSPGFNRPLRVTFEKEGFQTLIVDGQRTANLSVFLTQISIDASTGSGSGGAFSGTSGSSESLPSTLPSGSTAAGGSTVTPEYSDSTIAPVLSGSVTGFKLPRDLAPNEIAMAEVWTVPASYYSTPPFGSSTSPALRDARGERWRVTSDGGPFTIYGSFGRQSLYALFGIYDTETQTLTPHLMGLLRGVSVSDATPAVDLDLRLDMHLDQSIDVTVLPAPEPIDPDDTEAQGRVLSHALHAWLTLGNDGYIDFGPATGPGPVLTLTGLPRLGADNFLFLNRSVSADSRFSSYCFHRAHADSADGLTLGPILGRLVPVIPDIEGDSGEDNASADNGTSGDASNSGSTGGFDLLPFNGTIRWRFADGVASDLLRLYVTILHGDGSLESLEAILPGDATSLDLPPATAARLDPATASVLVSFQASRAPRFDFDFWSYSHFSTSSLSCWASGTFDVPLRRVSTMPQTSEPTSDE